MYRAITMGAALVLTTTVAVRQTILGLADISASNSKATQIGAPPPASRDPLRPPAPLSKRLDQSSLSFDVVSIDPQGTSVFAGQAPIAASVSIQANGRELATTTSDATGAWALTTDRKLAPGEYEFSLSAQSPHQEVIAGQSVLLRIAPPPVPASSTAKTEITSAQSAKAPITFIYNETTFTTQGRRAADLLAKYLLAQRAASVSLTGHADERGSDQYNLELSRARLAVVADYLRESGFAGKLELIPKGRSEPYSAVDRRALPKEDVFQLDRRVELLHTR
jgi:outer membrane protein OmpA-like peptidoglycan-associated protein